MYESCSIISNNYIFLKSEVIFLNVTNRSLCKKAKAIHVRAQNFLYKIRIYHPFPPENVPQNKTLYKIVYKINLLFGVGCRS